MCVCVCVCVCSRGGGRVSSPISGEGGKGGTATPNFTHRHQSKQERHNLERRIAGHTTNAHPGSRLVQGLRAEPSVHTTAAGMHYEKKKKKEKEKEKEKEAPGGVPRLPLASGTRPWFFVDERGQGFT